MGTSGIKIKFVMVAATMMKKTTRPLLNIQLFSRFLEVLFLKEV